MWWNTHESSATSVFLCATRLRESPPDVLVFEPKLPWGGGDGVLAMMGEEPQLARIPVMVLTPSHDSETLTRVARFPVSSFHLKPLAPDRLAANIRTLAAHPRQCFAMAEQTGRLELSIAKRTDRRVRNLRVDAVDGRIILSLKVTYAIRPTHPMRSSSLS